MSLSPVKEMSEEASIEEPKVEEVNKHKKKIQVNRVKPELLCDMNKGLFEFRKRIINVIQQEAESKPEQFVNNILAESKSWAYDTLPRYEYTYFLDRVRNTGKDPVVKTCLEKLRQHHSGEITETEFMDTYYRKAELHSNAPIN